MMARGRGFSGVAAQRRKLARLPDSFRIEMVEVLDKSGRALAYVMKRKLAATSKKRTGNLERGIDYKVNPKSLRLRVGLLRTKRGRSSLFYGRILDLGRKAQVVAVVRRSRVEAATGDTQTTRVLRRRQGSAATSMNIRAIAPKRFVTGRKTELRAAMRERLAGVWKRALQATPGLSDV